jgi:hypothetical protein
MPRPRRLAALVLAALTFAGTAACGGDDPAPTEPEQGRVRVVHAIGNAAAVDILVDGIVVSSTTPLSYGTKTNYVSLPAGPRQFALRLAGTTTNVVTFGLTVFANQDQSILAAGRLDGGTAPQERLVPIRDGASPAAGQASLRVVHASPPVGNVDVYVTAPGADIAMATPVLSNVIFGAVQDPLTLAPGTYRIRVTPTGSKTVAIDRTDVVLAANGRYLAIAVGDDAPGTGAASPFTVMLFPENAN